MFARLSTVLALFAVAAQVAVAVPPACLIAAVNTQSDPSDMKSVCNDGATVVQKYLSSNCGDNLNTAQSAFAAVCKDAGVTVSQSSSSSSSSSSTHTSKGSSSETSGTHTKSGSIQTATLSNGANSVVTGTSGFATKTTNGAQQTATSSSSSSDPTSSSGTESGTPTASQTDLSATHTGGASRLGMDIVGLVAVGAFGAMMAM